MSTLRDFLASRETEIREQIKLLRAELAELKLAKAAVEKADGTGDEGVEGEVRDSPRATIKDMVRAIFALPEATDGMAAGELLEAIDRQFGVKVERTSLSPQLSRLRDSGDVVLQDGRWFPSQPRLGQPTPSSPASQDARHYGGGTAIPAVYASKEAAISAAQARLSSALHGRSSAIEEALRGAASSASDIALVSHTPNVDRAMEEAHRKMQAVTAGFVHGVQKNWGSGPKTE